MKKAILGFAVGFAFLFLASFAAFVWPTRYKYHTLRINELTLTMREDRFSDKTWRLIPSGWVENKPQKPDEKLTAQMLAKVAGKCDLWNSEVTCDISNASDYALHSLTVEFHPNSKPNDQTDSVPFVDLFACKADLTGYVAPHTLGRMRVAPPCVHDFKPGQWGWNILSASGYAE